MRLKIIICIILCAFVKKHRAQNLVPNYSFENHTDCSTNVLRNAMSWCSVSNNCSYLFSCQTNPLYTTPYQYQDACIQSYQIPRTGNAYTELAGYITTSTLTPDRYAQVKLTDTLRLNKTYCISFYLSLWNYCQYSTDKLGAVLTPTPFPCLPPATAPNYTVTGVVPQLVSPAGVQLDDTLNWMEVSGVYTANGTEAYLTLGDFFPQAQHSIVQSYPGNCNAVAEYYLDDVSIEEVHPAKTKNDSAIAFGDSILIGNNLSDAATYSWQPTAGLSCTACANPMASPSVTTTYTVTKKQCKAITTDQIKITVGTVGIKTMTRTDNRVKLYPNPNNGNFSLNIADAALENAVLKLYNVNGQLVHEQELSGNAAGIYELHLNLSNGLYLAEINDILNGIHYKQKVVITH